MASNHERGSRECNYSTHTIMRGDGKKWDTKEGGTNKLCGTLLIEKTGEENACMLSPPPPHVLFFFRFLFRSFLVQFMGEMMLHMSMEPNGGGSWLQYMSSS